jgi:biopolymer transport protein ExbD
MLGLMLVLCIVLMVMTPMLLPHDFIEPPHSRYPTARPRSRTDIRLGIDRDGNYYLNSHPIRESALESALQDLFVSRPDEYVLYVWADRNLEYGVVRKAMDVGARSGARVVDLVVYDSLPAVCAAKECPSILRMISGRRDH